MNRNTRIFFYGTLLIGLGLWLYQAESFVLGLGLGLVGLVMSGQAAFMEDDES